MLSVLEYISRMHGIHVERKEIFWGSFGEAKTEFEQVWRRSIYRIVSNGRKAEAFVDGKKIFEAPVGSRIVTDYSGKVLRVEKNDEKADVRGVRVY